MLARLAAPFRDFAPLPLRLVMGVAFMVHGYPKITAMAATAERFAQMGFVPGIFWGPLVAIVEFVGGACLVLGLFSRYWSLALALEMLVTTLRVKIPGGAPFVSTRVVGYELDLIFLAAALTLVILGSGAVSADRTILKKDF